MRLAALCALKFTRDDGVYEVNAVSTEYYVRFSNRVLIQIEYTNLGIHETLYWGIGKFEIGSIYLVNWAITNFCVKGNTLITKWIHSSIHLGFVILFSDILFRFIENLAITNRQMFRLLIWCIPHNIICGAIQVCTIRTLSAEGVFLYKCVFVMASWILNNSL